ncbi:DUF6236 family protein [Pantoea agglomerans]|uniref:DUF6236 family protein n=1 Tax=Enterobacter agglomerans TaxID=549 RepID=UPI0004D68752|nr:DUF6236 family protein [Pantoea agglomerans]KEY42688.1 hypothetical protein FB99_11400 [Pantoea agglomerans]
MIRGVVALPFEIRQEKDGGFWGCGGISPLDLNYFALYWDKISVPDNNFLGFRLPNEDVFIDCGVLERPMMNIGGRFHSNDFPKFLAEEQIGLVDKLRRMDKSSYWSIHQKGDGAVIATERGVVKETVRLELSNLLPVPSADIHIHEILEFKQRRKDELEALHSYCDDLYFEVINSADPCLQAAKSFNNLKQAIENLDKLNSEGWRSPIKFDLNISPEFDFSQVRAGLATIISAFNTPHPLETVIMGSVIGLIEGSIKIAPKLQRMREGENKSLVYVANAKREGLV